MSMQHKKEQYMVHTKADVKTDSFLGLLTASDKTEIETMIASKVRELNSTLTASETNLVIKLREYEGELKKQQHLVAQLQKANQISFQYIKLHDLGWYNTYILAPPQQEEDSWLNKVRNGFR
jgi:hypothetical protein